MLSSLRIIHPPCSDNPTNLPVLLLSVESQRYIFNTPEGTTRSLIQRGAKGTSRGLGHIFLPKVGVEECGGLPGLLMSLADAQRPDITIHGPPVLTHWLATCRYHLRRDSIKVSVVETPDLSSLASSSKNPDYVVFKDENITIDAVPILPTAFELPIQHTHETHGRSTKRHRPSQQQVSTRARSTSPSTLLRIMFPNDNGPALDQSPTNAEGLINGHTNGPNKAANRPVMSKNAMDPPVLAPVPIDPTTSLLHQAPVLMYIVQGSTIRGKLDAKKANSMGVPTGRLLGQLSNGQDVQIERPKNWFQWEKKKQVDWLAKRPLAIKRPIKRRRSASQSRSDATTDECPAKEPEEEVETVLIKSADVMGTPRTGAAFVQIYLPSTQYLDSFLSDSVQARLQEIPEEPHAIVHCVHPDILVCPAYQSFLAKYKQAHHIIVSRPYLPDQLAFPSSAMASLRMSHLDKDLFAVPLFNLTPELKLKDAGIEGENIHLAKMDTNISLHPRGPPTNYDDLALEIDSSVESDKVKSIASFKIIPGRKKIEPAAMKAKQEGWKQYIQKVQNLKEDTVMTNGYASNGIDEDDLKITTLGTGSALPSKYRNVSGTLVHMPGKDAGYILLDAGESTYSQLKRKFQDKTDEVITNIRLIFLSHAHADHHMGTTRLLLERAKLAVSRPLFIIAPHFLRRYLGEVQQIESLGINSSGDLSSNGVIFIDSEYLDSRHGVALDEQAFPELRDANLEEAYKVRLCEDARKILARQQNDRPIDDDSVSRVAGKLYKDRSERRLESKATREVMIASLHGTQVYTTEVDHRTSNCYGIILRGKGWSAAYSGDTRPCANLVCAGKGVDLLIHEATLEDSEPEMADIKGHSTFGQAIQIGKDMGVKYIMLTHFSQRYPKLPKLKSDTELGNVKVGIGFDLLTARMSDFDKMMRYREALEILFEVDGEEEDGALQEESKEKESVKGVEIKSARASIEEKRSKQEESGQMDIDSVNDIDVSKRDDDNQKKEIGKRHFERKYIKSYEYQYICFYLKPVQKIDIDQAGMPSRLSIAQAIQDELIDLNGLVNASFNWELLDVQMKQIKKGIRVIVKVPSSHIQAMQATISSGLSIHTNGITFQAQYEQTCSSLDLISLNIGDSQGWFESISKSVH